MSRDDGFTIADVSVAFLRDPKVRQLRARGLEGGAAVLIYLGVVLSSWEHGERLTLSESDTPFPATPKRVAMLREVGMIDPDGRIPGAIWAAWFGPAQARKQERREAGRRGGQAKARNARATSPELAEPLAQPYPSDPIRTVVEPPTPAGRGLRSTGTSPRQIAARAQQAREAELAVRRETIRAIRQRYYRGEITEAELESSLRDLDREPDDLTRESLDA